VTNNTVGESNIIFGYLKKLEKPINEELITKITRVWHEIKAKKIWE